MHGEVYWRKEVYRYITGDIETLNNFCKRLFIKYTFISYHRFYWFSHPSEACRTP